MGWSAGDQPSLAFCLVSLTWKRFVPNGSGHAMNGYSKSISDKPVLRHLSKTRIDLNRSMSALACMHYS